MKVGNCPSCGAEVDFAPGAGKVKVCEFCSTVVLRGEANLEDLGKVAELVDTDSPLKLMLSGRHSGTPFTVVGRIQKVHDTADGSAYGAWDEWHLSFEDGRTAWLSESEGEWNLMFPLTNQRPPAFDAANPGTEFQLKGTRFVVEERSHARTVSAQGQLPDFHPKHPFVDATGPKGVFVSIDYGGGEPGEAFVGSVTTLAALGFDKSELSSSPKRQAMSQARCTQCNGMLELKAPDVTRRVGCPFCGALLDCSNGTLSFLQLLARPQLEPQIPLGRKGTLEGVEWTCLAFLVRSCEVEGTRYAWFEYLLYAKDQGFRWLMNSNGHWTFLTPVAAGEVVVGFKQALHAGQSYALYQTVNTTTDYVVGECYWAVSQNERGFAAEYIAPPHSLNLDRTQDEVSFTRGVLLEPKQVQAAFKVKDIGTPSGVASAQVNPYKQKASSTWSWSLGWAAAIIALFVVFAAMGSSQVFHSQNFTVPPGAVPQSPEAMSFSDPFQVGVRTPLEVNVSGTGLNNEWLGVQTDLVNTDSWEVISLYFELDEYHGVTEGESWAERNANVSKSTADVTPGNYVMRVTPSWEASRQPPRDPVAVRVKADPPGMCCPLMLVLMVLLIPAYLSVRSSAFESARWNDSVMQPPDYSGQGGGQQHRAPDDDDEDDE
ncbi:MAG: hypothetical protein H6Q89_2789 [Myxococcaceae bacterium]|nr:hypothetical protein [Myxococcaceae bacterium]